MSCSRIGDLWVELDTNAHSGISNENGNKHGCYVEIKQKWSASHVGVDLTNSPD